MSENDDDVSRPIWLDSKLFPFKSKWMKISGHYIHYVDEGNGPTLLFLHGIPTWSFYYRNVITNLRNDFRCIALDLPGFGLSRAPKGFEYTVENEYQIFGQFVEALSLSKISMMAHSIGGPIALNFASRNPNFFQGLILGGGHVCMAAERNAVYLIDGFPCWCLYG